MPLAIYERFSTDFTGALALSAVLVCVSAALLLGVKLVALGGRPCCAVEARDRAAGRSSSSSRWTCRAGDCLALAGPVGRGQDDRAADRRRAACGPIAGGSRCGDETWLDTAARHRPAARAPALRLRLPGLRALPAPSAPGATSPTPRRPGAERGARSSCSTASALGDRADAGPAELSGGERQRVALARALAREPGRAAARRAALGARRAHPRGARRASSRRPARRRRPRAARHPRLRRGGAARRPRRRDRPRPDRPAGPARASSRRAPPSAFVADFTGAVVLHGHGGAGRRRADARRRSTAAARSPAPTPAERAGGGERLSLGDRARAAGRGPRLGAEPPRGRVVSVTESAAARGSACPPAQPLVAEVTAAAVARPRARARAPRVTATWKAAATRLTPR